MHWLAQLPKLNPIEYLRALVKKKLNQYESTPCNILELWDGVHDVWCLISTQECRGLDESMPRQIAIVIVSIERGGLM